MVSRRPLASLKMRCWPAASRPWKSSRPDSVDTDIQVRSVVTRISAMAWSVRTRATEPGGGDAGGELGGADVGAVDAAGLVLPAVLCEEEWRGAEKAAAARAAET